MEAYFSLLADGCLYSTYDTESVGDDCYNFLQWAVWAEVNLNPADGKLILIFLQIHDALR